MRIVYIDIDTLRPDHLGCYGYHRHTSPWMDQVATDGVIFRQYFTSDAPCLPSRAALYTGRFGIQSGVVGHGGTAADPKLEGKPRWFRDTFDRHNLPARLQKLGYQTVLISPFAQRHGANWFYVGFREIHNTGNGGMETAEEVRPVLEKWLSRENLTADNWYLHVNLWDPHTPYRTPAEVGEPFKDDPLPRWLDDEALIHRHLKMTGPHTAQDVNMYDDRESSAYPRQPGKVTDRASMRRLIDGYDTGIRYADEQVRLIIERLKTAGVYEDTAIIISSDHGENFGELGLYAEHGTADVATCWIPLIVKWPGGGRGKEARGLHYNLDWAPTLMELLGQKASEQWDGRSFAGAVRDGAEQGREELILSQCCHVCQRSVRFGKWLYMRTWHDGFHLFPQEMLFDIEADPHEQEDVGARHPEICREGAWRLMRWHDQQMQNMTGAKVDPMWTVIAEGGPFHAIHEHGRSPLPQYLKRLEATGRRDGADALRKKYAAHLSSGSTQS